MPDSPSLAVHSNGIYRGLPTFSNDLHDMTIIVTGASGISGRHMLRVLSENPQRWSRIFALSRTPPEDLNKLGNNTRFLPIDLMEGPVAITATLKAHQVIADYVMYFSYAQPKPTNDDRIWTNAEALCQVNGEMLSNFLQGLEGAEIRPKRFLLQTGAKNYGMHLGPASVPSKEDDQRVTLEPNFYYTQEDILAEYSKRTSVPWTVTRPAAIPGASANAAMNIAYAVAVYASVQKYLDLPLVFPGDSRAWEKENTQSSATMNAYLAEWAVLTPETANQALNAADGSPFTYGNLWKELAQWYGVEYVPPSPDDEYHELPLAHPMPPRGYDDIEDFEALADLGRFAQGNIRYTYTFTEWAKRSNVQVAWKELSAKHSLKGNPFADGALEKLFGFLDMTLLKSWPTSLSVDKIRKMGFYGYVESCEAIYEACMEYEQMKLVPPMMKPRPRS